MELNETEKDFAFALAIALQDEDISWVASDQIEWVVYHLRDQYEIKHRENAL